MSNVVLLQEYSQQNVVSDHYGHPVNAFVSQCFFVAVPRAEVQIEVVDVAPGWQFNRIKNIAQKSPKNQIERDISSYLHKMLKELFCQNKKGSKNGPEKIA